MQEILSYYRAVNTTVSSSWSSGSLTIPTIRTNHTYRYIFLQFKNTSGRPIKVSIMTQWVVTVGNQTQSKSMAQGANITGDGVANNIVLAAAGGTPKSLNIHVTTQESITLVGIYLETYSPNVQVTAGNKITTTDWYNVFGTTKSSGAKLLGSEVGLSGKITASAWNSGVKGTTITW